MPQITVIMVIGQFLHAGNPADKCELPPIDRQVKQKFQTATFALG